ncbi:MAG TPA: hypothetical protein VI457_07500 [Methylococcaceae bacterium]|nr:hypothetical protein [Methylococcaceae bacterium]
MSKAAAEFEKAWRALPDCVDLDLLAMTTIEDLVAAAEIRLDLINEGQDGTENDDPRAIKKWLRQFAAKGGAA